MSHTIELTTNTRTTEPLVLTFDTQAQALDTWDNMVDSAIPGDTLTLKGPNGGVLSQYKPVNKEWNI